MPSIALEAQLCSDKTAKSYLKVNAHPMKSDRGAEDQHTGCLFVFFFVVCGERKRGGSVCL